MRCLPTLLSVSQKNKARNTSIHSTMTPLRFSIVLTSIAIVLGIAIFILPPLAVYSQKAILGAVILSYVSTMGVFFASHSVLQKSFRQFMYAVLGAMMGKMFLGIISVLVVAVLYKDVKKEYVFACFFSYFLFTAIEVYGLMRNLRQISGK